MKNIHQIADEIARRLTPAFIAMCEARTLAEYGERCPDYEPGCPCCDAWAFFDRYGICPTERQLRDFRKGE